ncbi:MAG: hypothetical protein H6742_11985 [Alphaproteobacteria bacterium]|nr:hypothetical protein [Alphaproteobacteria bacterium]
MEDIDGVVAALDRIIDIEHQRGSRAGYFPCMYRATTLRVARGLSEGRFVDAERMERLDVVFADFYLDAWRRHGVAQACSGPWHHAFQSARDPQLLILQHLLLGMNAHINLDLAQAAVAVAGDGLDGLRQDFDTINDILAEQLDQVQDALNAHSPALSRLDEAGGSWDERLFSFSLARARDAAWTQARVLVTLPGAARPTALRALDRQSSTTARIISSVRLPGARAAEPDVDRDGVRRVIETLRQLG